MTHPKETHPFSLKFREEDKHRLEFIFSLEFMRDTTPSEIVILNIETNCKNYLNKGDKQEKFIARLLETIKENRDLAREYGELWRR